MLHTDISQTRHEVGRLKKHAQTSCLFVLQQLPHVQDFHVGTLSERLCRNAMCKNGFVFFFALIGCHLSGTGAIGNPDVYATLFPQLILVKVSCAVGAYVHRSVTSERVTLPVAPQSNYDRWKFPIVDVMEGSVFPLIFWHSLKINNAITPRNGFSQGYIWRTEINCFSKTCFYAYIWFCALQMCSRCQQVCVDVITELWKTKSVWHR